MLTLILVILIAGIVASYFMNDREETLFSFVCSIFVGVVCFAMLCAGGELTKQSVIEQKIAMYEEENQIIESRIDAIVEEYMEYEGNTYKAFKSEDAVSKISMFPELKSDSLVEMQINTYLNNQKELVTLKRDKINIGACRWWLYFGN